MLEAALARIFIPKEAGGYGLGFDTWFEVTRELSQAYASHGWCASLIIHHNHLTAQYPEAATRPCGRVASTCQSRVSLVPVVQAIARRRWLSHLKQGFAVRQRRRSLHLGYAQRPGARRRHQRGAAVLPGTGTMTTTETDNGIPPGMDPGDWTCSARGIPVDAATCPRSNRAVG